jgi:hypothetical protein
MPQRLELPGMPMLAFNLKPQQRLAKKTLTLIIMLVILSIFFTCLVVQPPLTPLLEQEKAAELYFERPLLMLLHQLIEIIPSASVIENIRFEKTQVILSGYSTKGSEISSFLHNLEQAQLLEQHRSETIDHFQIAVRLIGVSQKTCSDKPISLFFPPPFSDYGLQLMEQYTLEDSTEFRIEGEYQAVLDFLSEWICEIEQFGISTTKQGVSVEMRVK